MSSPTVPRSERGREDGEGEHVHVVSGCVGGPLCEQGVVCPSYLFLVFLGEMGRADGSGEKQGWEISGRVERMSGVETVSGMETLSGFGERVGVGDGVGDETGGGGGRRERRRTTGGCWDPEQCGRGGSADLWGIYDAAGRLQDAVLPPCPSQDAALPPSPAQDAALPPFPAQEFPHRHRAFPHRHPMLSFPHTSPLTQAAVPKYMQLRLEPASSTTLSPGGPAATQRLLVNNTQHGAKPLIMRLRVSFVPHGGPKVEETVEVSNLPPGL
eukprot:141955-Chlamydomonas_euryale.AAC.6